MYSGYLVRAVQMRVFRHVLASIRFFVEVAVKRVIHAIEYTVVNSSPHILDPRFILPDKRNV